MTNPKVDEYLEKVSNWKDELEKLREIMLEFQLEEDLKWGKPCYSYNKSNIAILIGFKEYCAISFFKGSLLNDEKGILIKPGENSQASRQIRFKSIEEIAEKEDVLKEYITKAIEIEKLGMKVDFKKNDETKIPYEFQIKLDEDPILKSAFFALTPGRQRAYIIYFSQPKQSKTREARVDKYIGKILSGKGLND
ncbi:MULTISPECIES: YdeI/OmpD-associated family protein [Thermoanaerobacterium]|uniref:YdhG-like domain-containing protein n=2 Tax=Thermoanaerobacterium TaxID=28895 RepID=W9E9S6_9THEO|nr:MULTISPECIES: DUF1801 domain-containing protein [Thermoanaerobacterium]AFK87530.1 protein of unknown function DUF1801 [Thermoanaerobacterium saccharolyticum JW/SL-YS485]ETO37635.1 hypothetical protein V518_2158 [Thermoanaerobacterium aotearoense SCUT27]